MQRILSLMLVGSVAFAPTVRGEPLVQDVIKECREVDAYKSKIRALLATYSEDDPRRVRIERQLEQLSEEQKVAIKRIEPMKGQVVERFRLRFRDLLPVTTASWHIYARGNRAELREHGYRDQLPAGLSITLEGDSVVFDLKERVGGLVAEPAWGLYPGEAAAIEFRLMKGLSAESVKLHSMVVTNSDGKVQQAPFLSHLREGGEKHTVCFFYAPPWYVTVVDGNIDFHRVNRASTHPRPSPVRIGLGMNNGAKVVVSQIWRTSPIDLPAGAVPRVELPIITLKTKD